MTPSCSNIPVQYSRYRLYLVPANLSRNKNKRLQEPDPSVKWHIAHFYLSIGFSQALSSSHLGLIAHSPQAPVRCRPPSSRPVPGPSHAASPCRAKTASAHPPLTWNHEQHTDRLPHLYPHLDTGAPWGARSYACSPVRCAAQVPPANRCRSEACHPTIPHPQLSVPHTVDKDSIVKTWRQNRPHRKRPPPAALVMTAGSQSGRLQNRFRDASSEK